MQESQMSTGDVVIQLHVRDDVFLSQRAQVFTLAELNALYYNEKVIWIYEILW